MSINTLLQFSVAFELISLKLRISVVSEITTLPHAFLRKAYVDMHGKSPPRGSIKVSPEFIYKSYNLQKEATLFIIFLFVEISKNISPHKKSIRAYNSYIEYIKFFSKKPAIDFSDAWVLTKWFNTGEIKLVRCLYCRSAKLQTKKKQYHCCCVCKK